MPTIKELRALTHLSQGKFAAYIGIPLKNIQNWEQGIANPPEYVTGLIVRIMRHEGYRIED